MKLSHRQHANLCQALSKHGVSWEQLTKKTEQIVLFGSRAAGLEGEHSDWDLLCIGNGGTSLRSPELDLIWVSPAQAQSTDWLSTELANHIAKYGIWLHGVDNWSHKARVGKSSLAKKVKAIRRDGTVLTELWPRLAPRFRGRRALRIRRNLQRANYLRRLLPVPPTAVLDNEWARQGNRSQYLTEVANKLSVAPDLIGLILACQGRSGEGV